MYASLCFLNTSWRFVDLILVELKTSVPLFSKASECRCQKQLLLNHSFKKLKHTRSRIAKVAYLTIRNVCKWSLGYKGMEFLFKITHKYIICLCVNRYHGNIFYKISYTDLFLVKQSFWRIFSIFNCKENIWKSKYLVYGDDSKNSAFLWVIKNKYFTILQLQHIFKKRLGSDQVVDVTHYVHIHVKILLSDRSEWYKIINMIIYGLLWQNFFLAKTL